VSYVVTTELRGSIVPYIITTNRYLDDPTAEFLPGAKPGVSRRAVATLDEARDEVFRLWWQLDADSTSAKAVDDLVTDQGGTVGPLPDGTVIEVERVDIADLVSTTRIMARRGRDDRRLQRSAGEGGVMALRKHTVFEPCKHHAAMYTSENRYRRAEVMVEGGYGSSPCPGDRCRMRPGTDFYTAEFVAEHPNVYYVGD
jgi:hypothetical protein